MENKMSTHLFGDILYWTSVDPKKAGSAWFFSLSLRTEEIPLYLGMLSLSHVNRDHK